MPDNKDELREIENLIQKAEEYAAKDKSTFAGMDNNLMNRQTLFNGFSQILKSTNRNQLKSLKAKLPEKVLKKPDPPHHKNKYPVRACISHNFKNFRCTNCGGIQASYDTGLDDKQIGRNEVIDQVNKILDEMIGE